LCAQAPSSVPILTARISFAAAVGPTCTPHGLQLEGGQLGNAIQTTIHTHTQSHTHTQEWLGGGGRLAFSPPRSSPSAHTKSTYTPDLPQDLHHIHGRSHHQNEQPPALLQHGTHALPLSNMHSSLYSSAYRPGGAEQFAQVAGSDAASGYMPMPMPGLPPPSMHMYVPSPPHPSPPHLHGHPSPSKQQPGLIEHAHHHLTSPTHTSTSPTPKTQAAAAAATLAGVYHTLAEIAAAHDADHNPTAAAAAAAVAAIIRAQKGGSWSPDRGLVGPLAQRRGLGQQHRASTQQHTKLHDSPLHGTAQQRDTQQQQQQQHEAAGSAASGPEAGGGWQGAAATGGASHSPVMAGASGGQVSRHNDPGR